MAPRGLSGERIELRYGTQRALAVEVGAGLCGYWVGTDPVAHGYGERELPSGACGQTLMPWPNRLRDGSYEFAGEHHQLPLSEPARGNALHGLVRWANWTPTRRSESSVRLEHVLHAQEGYPFVLSLSVEYELGEGGLTVRSAATNVGEQAAPFGAGHHPYVTVGAPTIDTCSLRGPGRRYLPTDERAIPTGARSVAGTQYDFLRQRPVGATVLDTAFDYLERDADGLARVKLATGDGARALTVWQDASYPYLMLFTGDPIEAGLGRRRSLGVEPMTCAPNGLQTGDGLLVLEPGQAFAGSWGITPSPIGSDA
ncbi:MAG: aldose 1-epimerase family protein [Solirubrobacteraceae bacterium]